MPGTSEKSGADSAHRFSDRQPAGMIPRGFEHASLADRVFDRVDGALCGLVVMLGPRVCLRVGRSL
jgi:hypothetical protein